MALKSESSNAKLKLIDDVTNIGLEVSYDGANSAISTIGAGNLTVDGRDVATDGTKLDGIAPNATNVTNNSNLINGAGYLIANGSNTITGTLIPDTNVARNLGSSTQRFNTVFAVTFDGTASSAEYADLAERFEADSIYLPGTVVELGGVAEITKAIKSLSDNVFGVISTKAAYLLNSKAGTDETHPCVALHGRVPVRVIGKVNKGDRLVSAGNGIARVATHAEYTPFNVIGRSLENKKSKGEGIIEAIVKTN